MMSTTLDNLESTSGSTLEARAVHRDETDAMIELMCRCFHLDLETARRIFYSDPFFDLSMKRVLVEPDTGAIISCLTLIPTQLRASPSETIPVCGIAGVCTEPELRGKGHARRLIRQTLADLSTELNYDLTALTAARPEFYQALGWELCGVALEWSAPAQALPRYADGEKIRELSSEEAAARAQDIHKLYTQAKSGVEAGAFTRDERRWRCIEKLTIGRRIAVYERGDGGLAGYAAYEIRPDEVANAAYVHEIVARDGVARRALMGYFASGQCAPLVLGRCSHEDAVSLGLLSLPGVNIQVQPNLFMRLADLPKLLSRLLAHTPPPSELSRFPDGLAIVVLPDQAAGRDGALVRALGRRTQVSSLSGQGADLTRIFGDAGAITQMVIGYKTATELLAEGRLRVTSRIGSSAPALVGMTCDALFPRLNPYLGLPDIF